MYGVEFPILRGEQLYLFILVKAVIIFNMKILEAEKNCVKIIQPSTYQKSGVESWKRKFSSGGEG